MHRTQPPSRAATTRLARWLDARLVHPSLRDGGPDLRRRAHLAIVFAALAGVGGCWLAVNHLLYGVTAHGLLILVFSLSALVAIALLRRTGSLVAVGNIMAGLWFAAMIATMLARGGLSSHGAMGAGAVPVVAVVLAGRRSGWMWCLATVGLLLALFALQASGLPLRDHLAPEARLTMALVSTCLFALLMFAMASAHEAMKSAAIAVLARTERRKLAAETEAKLAEAERLAAVGRLSAAVAHEINNPLAYIIGNVAHLRERLAAGATLGREEADEVLADVLEGAERVQTIVRDLDTFSRADEEIRSVDVGAAVGAAMRMAEHQIRPRAALGCQILVRAPVLANEGRIGQVLLNLLINAAQAIPAGRADDHRVDVVARDRGKWVSIEVRDTGNGIPAELLARVTEPFFTTKPVGEGTGLGLSVCKNIVERLGGKLQIESAVGVGTTVRVLLPRAQQPATTPRRSRSQPAMVALSRRVLVVDDDPFIARHLGRVLRGHEVITARSGAEALALLEVDADYDLILCDLMMPEMTGAELCARIDARYPQLLSRVAIVTGGAFTEETQRFLAKFEGRVLTKPFTPEEVRGLVAARGGPAIEPSALAPSEALLA